MTDFLVGVLPETARIFYEGSLYILLGFAIAGLLHEFLPTELIARHLGRDDLRAVATAALFGAPIPLCSCGVLPAAAALRRKGARRSPLMSFLVSTPETGVDSIALTYGLLGGVMAVVRPVVAVVTALVAGVLSMLIPGRDEPRDEAVLDELAHHHAHDHGHDPQAALEHGHADTESPDPHAADAGWRPRLERAGRYGFVTLLDDLAFWLVVGIGLTGVMSAALPDDFFSTALGLDGGLLPMLLVILAGVPLYLCASASTPVAAALIAKGLSPGAALVFLLVGPATNAATIAVVSRLVGPRRLRIYLGSIVGVALAAGLLLDALAADAVRAATLGGIEGTDPPLLSALKILAAFAFVGLLAWSALRTGFAEGRRDARDQWARFRRWVRGLRSRDLLRAPFLGTAALLLAALALPASMLVVEPGERGIVQRLGRVVAGDLSPGLHLHLPPPLGRGTAVDVAHVRQVEVGAASTEARRMAARSDPADLYITADENLIDIRGVVHYRVGDPVRFALGLEDDAALVRSLARGELLGITATTPIDTLYTTARQRIERTLREQLRRRMEALDLGIEIVDARLLDVHAPSPVHAAFRDVASALEDRLRTIHEGHAYAVDRLASAEGEATVLQTRAQAEALRAGLRADAEAAGFAALSHVHREHRRLTEARLYLEALDRSLVAPRKYIDGVSDADGELDLWIGPGASPPTGGGADSGRLRPSNPREDTR